MASTQTLSQFIPADRILTKEADRAAYDADAQTAYRCRATAAVLPETTEEMIEIVRWCHRESIPFVVRGSGTGLSAGATPVEEGIVIVTTKLNRILEIDPVQRIAVVQPGVVNADVTKAAAAHGLFFAPDPSSQPVCSIGGNIGFNAGGAHCLKYGMTSNHVLGLKAVLASGEIVEWGGCTRDFVGPDYTGLFVGNEGLFGVVLEATLNLLPVPDGCHTVLAGFKSAEAAGDAVSAIIASGLVPVAMELMDELTIKAVRPVVPINYPPDCNALLLIELDGPAPIVAAEQPRLEALLQQSATTGIISAKNETERANIWKVRKSSYSAFGRLAPNNFVQDSVVPRRHLGAVLREVYRIADAAGMQCPNVCHAGDGNLHPNLLYDGEDPGAFHRAEQAAGEILRMCVEFGGSITGEHGVGLEKRAYLSLMYGAGELDLFHRLHGIFDPREISNPGKMLPPGGDASPPVHPLEPDDATRAIARQITERAINLAIGGGTKSITESSVEASLPVGSLSGITAYEPVEFILSARAGTPLREIESALEAEGQQLPFDPLLAESGATLGGTIAAGLNGPGALGYGRLRDAVMGMTFIDGRGAILRVGAAVVKNVAGFDLPKFFVGSHGSLGVITEVTLKVCPAPTTSNILEIASANLDELTEHLTFIAQLSTAPVAVEASLGDRKIWVRFDAPESALPALADSLGPLNPVLMDAAEGQKVWASLKEFEWAPTAQALIKIPLGLARMAPFFAAAGLDQPELSVHVSLAGDVAYLALPTTEMALIRQRLKEAGFSSSLIRGPGPRLIASDPLPQVAKDLKKCLDPDNRLGPLPGLEIDPGTS